MFSHQCTASCNPASLFFGQSTRQNTKCVIINPVGARDRTVAGMILKESLGLGLVGYSVGKLAATG